jgi:hypothetical protein
MLVTNYNLHLYNKDNMNESRGNGEANYALFKK